MKNKNLFKIWNRNKIHDNQSKKTEKNEGKVRTVFKILGYGNKKDKTVLMISLLAAIANGLIPQFSTMILLTPMVTLFLKLEAQGNLDDDNEVKIASKITEYGYTYFIVCATQFAVGFIQIMASETVSRNIMTKIKTAYLAKMLSIDISWYDKSQEQFVSTVSHDLHKMMYMFDSKMSSAVEMVSSFFFGCLVGFLGSWKVALLTSGLMLVSITIIYFIIQMSKNKEKFRHKHNVKCTKIASEVLSNTRVVAAYGGEYTEIERYKSSLKMANKYGLKHAIVISTAKAFSYFQMCICYLVAYYFSVNLYLVDDFDPGYLSLILSAQINVIYHSTSMLNIISDIFMATDSAYRVMQFLNSEISYTGSTEKGEVPEIFEASISFKNVKFSYPTNLKTKVLQDLTMDIEPGKVTAVVGTSGAGKSTIVGLTMRLYDIIDGQILIGGVDIRKLNIHWLRSQIGVVGQEPMLFDASIEENIRYGKTTATLEEIIEAAKIANAHSFIEKLPSGYSSIVGERATKLSGGQKQRIAIARAIVRKPKLLLLDEATSALDSYSEGIVQIALNNAMRDRTTLIIAHRMTTVRNADVIYALKDGCVVEKGSHSELMMLKGYYYSLVKVLEPKEKNADLTQSLENSIQDDAIKEDVPFVDDNIIVEPKIAKHWSINKENLKVFIVWILAILFTSTSSAFLPSFFYVFSLLNQSFTHPNTELGWIALKYVGFLFGLGLVSFFAVLLSGIMSTIATQLWLEKLQKKVFDKLVSMDISWFDKSGSSPNECLAILTNSPPLIESVTGDRAAQVVIFILSLLFSIVYSFFFSTNITLTNLLIILVFLILNCLRIKLRVTDTKSATLTARSTKVAAEFVQNVKTIQILNCQKYITNQYQDMLILSKREAFGSIIWYAVVYGVTKILTRLSFGISFLFGANDIASGNLKGTFLLSIVGTLGFATMSAGPALVLMSQYPEAKLAIKRLYRIASTKTLLNILTDRGIKPEISGNIIFQDVVFSYPTRDEVLVLNKINLNIEAGKSVALVGESGCGKSTIISLLERFYLPNKGKILIDGNDINDINVRYLRSQMGLVTQEPVLFDMTIKENILYGVEEEVEMDKVIEVAKIANIHNFIMKLPQAYDSYVGDRGSNLSGGEKQRIAIARAILRNPKILLLDESTSALDTESEKVVQEALEKASVGKTTIVITHRLSTIRKADKIIVIKSGVIVEEGNHEQLIEKKGHYFNLLAR